MKKRKLFTVMAYQWKEETNSKLLYGSNISYLVFTYKIELILYLEHNQKRHDFNKNKKGLRYIRTQEYNTLASICNIKISIACNKMQESYLWKYLSFTFNSSYACIYIYVMIRLINHCKYLSTVYSYPPKLYWNAS